MNQHISVRVPEGKTPIARINSVSFMPVLTSCSVSDKRAELEGNAEAAVIYLASGSGETEGFNTSVPIKLTCDSLEFEQNSSMSYQFSLTDMQAALISGNEIEIRASFTVKFIPQNNGETEIITDVEEQDEYTMPEFGIIIYNAPQTEELWDICKRFGVDEEEVRSLNPDIGENVLAGQKIYVFIKLRQ